MLDIDALLHAVLNDPADDVARLVYADRLDETGVPMNAVRAEFIRLQIAGVGHERQHELAAAWLADWFQQPVRADEWGGWAVGREGGLESAKITLSRGFISSVGTYGAYAGEWNRWTPWQVAEAFAETVIGVFTDHPIECVEVDHYGDGEDWRIERWGDNTWAAYRRESVVMRVACETSVSREVFGNDLRSALREHVTGLAAANL